MKLQQKMWLVFTSTCGKFLSEVLPQPIYIVQDTDKRKGGGRLCQIFPWGWLLYILKKALDLFFTGDRKSYGNYYTIL